MKKRILGIVLLSTLLLSACTNEKDKEFKTANSKVEQLESRVKELESSSSSEEIESLANSIKNESNKTIVDAFVKADLQMYNPEGYGPHEIDINNEFTDLNSKPINGISFYTKRVDSGFEYIITILSFDSVEDLNIAKSSLDQMMATERQSINSNICAIIYASETMQESTFDEYRKVFEEIK